MMSACLLASCSTSGAKQGETKSGDDFEWVVDNFADAKILRYRVNGFEDLTPKQKELIYYLSEASIHGRDILFDQNFRWNMAIRRTLEAIYTNFNGDKSTADFKEFEVYLKRVWFSNGIHHHYSTDKFLPGFSETFFVEQVNAIPDDKLPLQPKQTKEEFVALLTEVMFDPNVYAKGSNQAAGDDLVRLLLSTTT